MVQAGGLAKNTNFMVRDQSVSSLLHDLRNKSSVLTDTMARVEGSNLLLQGTHPLIQAETLIGTVLN